MAARHVDETIVRFALTQHGVVSRRQLLAAGCDAGAIKRRVHAGHLLRATEGVYRVAAVPESWHARLWTAQLAGDADAAIAFEAAGALHELTTYRPGPVVVTVPHATARLTRVADVHQSRRLPAEHLTVIDGLVVTTVERTIIDLAAKNRRARQERLVDHSIAARKTSISRLCTTFDDLACRGRPGTALMRSLLGERSPGYVAPSSELEFLFLQLMRRAGLPRPVLQYPHPSPAMDGKFVDAAWVGRRVLVELDSSRWHDRSWRDQERDRERDALARQVRWDPYRFTWRNVTEQEDYVVGVLRSALRIAAA